MFATFLLLLWSHAPAPALSLPPRPPVRCSDGGTTGCVLSNAYGAWSSDRADCPVSSVAYPASEQEVVAAVARASASGARVKVVSGFAHTIPKLACPGGGNGTTTTLLISTARLAGVEVDVAARTVTADAGAPLRAVIDAAEASGLSLTAAPYWEGVSVAGLVSTGSHGSSWWGRGGAVHDHVVGLRLVVTAGEADGWARVLTLRRGDELFPAALVSLGLLGVVSKVGCIADHAVTGTEVQAQHHLRLQERFHLPGRLRRSRGEPRVRRHHLVPVPAHGRVPHRRPRAGQRAWGRRQRLHRLPGDAHRCHRRAQSGRNFTGAVQEHEGQVCDGGGGGRGEAAGRQRAEEQRPAVHGVPRGGVPGEDADVGLLRALLGGGPAQRVRVGSQVPRPLLLREHGDLLAGPVPGLHPRREAPAGPRRLGQPLRRRRVQRPPGPVREGVRGAPRPAGGLRRGGLQLLPRVGLGGAAAEPGRVGGGGAAGVRQARRQATLGQEPFGGVRRRAGQVPAVGPVCGG
eukprot:XP_008644209.1 uncharacterized protein LOC100501771 isoform X2 [Zea mays]